MAISKFWLPSSPSDALWLVLAAAVLLSVGWVVSVMWEERERNLNLPVVGSSGDQDLSQAVLEGYRKYPDGAFVIPTKPTRVMLPMSLLQEVASAPENKISFQRDVYKSFLGQFTGVGTGAHEVVPTVRGDLTKALASIMPLIQEEARYGFDREFGESEEWQTIPLFAKLLRVVALLSGRVFVGLPLSRNEEWINLSISYTTDLSNVLSGVAKWHPVLRPIIGRFLPEIRQARKDLDRSRQFMEPLVRDVLSVNDGEKTGPVKAGTRGTAISWLLSHVPANLRTAQRIGMDQMQLTFAAIHTTTMTSAFAILDLACRPKYITALREELEQVLREDGEALDEHGNRYITKSSVAKLKKLDSFLKESQRMNPLGFTASNRTLVTDYTFSNGLTLPRGTRIAFPMWGVYNSEAVRTFSPEYNAAAGNPGPEVFDGFRFARLREIPGRESSHQAVTTGPDSLNFGHGSHACPGRFFALYEIKTMVIDFIRLYDFRLAGDVDGVGGEDKRPKNFVAQTMNMPNFGAMLEIRRRKS